jgi:ketosteroid isomerase-like protein
MSLNRLLLFVLSVTPVLVFVSFAGLTGSSAPAAQSGDAKAQTDQEVLKINAECNAAELRGDVAAMDRCETEDFTHTHANGMVEHKAEYLQGVGSGAHKFLTLDLSDLHVRSYGTSAIVEGHIHLRANNSGRIADVNNQLMTVWVKQQGKWREAAWFAVGLPQSRAKTSETSENK